MMSLRRNGLRERFHPELTTQVDAAGFTALAFELTWRTRGLEGWKLITKRNEWFQRFSVERLERLKRDLNRTVFAYSYAARRIFEHARDQGWTTVLGQIDPGPPGEKELRRAYLTHSREQQRWQPAPQEYWDQWRQECELADLIVVNSDWSRDALIAEGLSVEKIKVIPLAIDPPLEAVAFHRQYPQNFDSQRPMRVLFLGQVDLRKGVGPLFEAIKLLKDEPLEFWFVGPIQVEIPTELAESSRVRFFGKVQRNSVARYYRDCDAFIFPALSDGFGLTQLEAQCWKLPVVASTHCGRVVRHGENGLLLEDISAETIVDTLVRLVMSPAELQRMSAASGIPDKFSLRSLGSSLLGL
jgi:glycosyltransferase involved in cell wall biosynthesis